MSSGGSIKSTDLFVNNSVRQLRINILCVYIIYYNIILCETVRDGTSKNLLRVWKRRPAPAIKIYFTGFELQLYNMIIIIIIICYEDNILSADSADE